MKKSVRFTYIAFALLFTFGMLLQSTSVANAETEPTTTPTFSDTKNHWAEDAIQWAVSQNMIKGYQDGTFRPNNKVTEAEFLAMLIRYYEPSLTGEVKKNWADPYYDEAATLNYILPGHSNLKSRDVAMTRTAVAELVSATEGVNYKGDNAIQYLLVYHLASGKNPNVISIANYDGKGYLTRAEAVQFIQNLSIYGLGTLIPKPSAVSDPADIPALETK